MKREGNKKSSATPVLPLHDTRACLIMTRAFFWMEATLNIVITSSGSALMQADLISEMDGLR